MPAPYTIVVSNHDAEDGLVGTGSVEAWDSTRGPFQVIGSGGIGGIEAFSGDNFFSGDAPETDDEGDWAIAFQDIDLTSVVDSTSELDNGSLYLFSSWHEGQNFADDVGMMMFGFLNSSGHFAEGHKSPGQKDYSNSLDAWFPRSFSTLVPSGSRTLRLFMCARLIGGSVANHLFDEINVELKEANSYAPSRKSWITFIQSQDSSFPSFINQAISLTPSIDNLKDSSGQDTGWSFEVISGAFQRLREDLGVASFCPIVPGNFVHDNTQTTTQDVGMRLNSLDNTKRYHIRLFGGRAFFTTNFVYNISLSMSGDTLSHTAYYNIDQTVEVLSIEPASDGSVIFTNIHLTDFSYISAIEVEELDTDNGGNGGDPGGGGTADGDFTRSFPVPVSRLFPNIAFRSFPRP